MPSVLSGQNDQLARHHSRPSSQSQTNLPEQIKSYPSPQSPNRSVGYLPATSYTPASNPRQRTPSGSADLPRLKPSVSAPTTRNPLSDNQNSSIDPHDFYRVYQDSFRSPGPTSGGLHQEALRPISPTDPQLQRPGRSESITANGSVSEHRPRSRKNSSNTPAIPGLRTRKASVKNLVAQINATATEDRPPLPAQPTSRSRSPTVSPVLGLSNQTHYTIGHRSLADPGTFSSPDSTSSTQTALGQRRPLFGEVLPMTASTPQLAGYGITNVRKRAGSESSPMHSPNPMFPPNHEENEPFLLSSATYVPSDAQRPRTQRRNSDLHSTPAKQHLKANLYSPSASMPADRRRPSVSSRIPVSTQRFSAASDSGDSGRNSRAESRVATDAKSPGSRLPVKQSQGQTDDHQTMGKITSPGRRGRTSAPIPPGSKSPSLRANIIAPPPKISPPLRSSRPRLPVSSASTAASRARMAEKFDAMQKMHNDKRSSQRRPLRPPELTDIDLKARRLKITQALTKSKESDELRGSYQSGKKWEPPRSRASSQTHSDSPSRHLSNQIPVLNVDAAPDTGSPGAVPSPNADGTADSQYATQSALRAMQVGTGDSLDDDDSPILGRNGRLPLPQMNLQTHSLDIRGDGEPSSALTDITVGTEGTNIDPEPQSDAIHESSNHSLLSHVMSMRETSPSTLHTISPQSPHGKDETDRADVESVNLILRNTTYMEHDEAVRKGYATAFAPQETPQEDEENKATERDSWTSSLVDDQGDISPILSQQQNAAGHGHFGNQSEIIGLSAPDYPEDIDSHRNTMASDAYTIVNIVLQQHSSSGVVDQQFVDDVYHRVVEHSPDIEEEGTYDPNRIEELCLQEIQRRESTTFATVPEAASEEASNAADQRPSTVSNGVPEAQSSRTSASLLNLPRVSYMGHRYKSSLDSAEDWADTSPSVGDWMRFASEQTSSSEDEADQQETTADGQQLAVAELEATEMLRAVTTAKRPPLPPSPLVPLDIDDDTLAPEEYGVAIIRPPSHSPPPPPKDDLPSIESAYQNSTFSASSTAVETRPQVPYRMASLGQTRGQITHVARSMTEPSREPSRGEVAPWESVEAADLPFHAEGKRLKQRKHVLRELVDTEFTYDRDMRVLCDIYMQTAAAALSEDDIRVLFGNIEKVQMFSRDFLAALKQTTKPAPSNDRVETRKDKVLDGTIQGNSSSSTLASATKSVDTEFLDLQKDRETRIGEAFERSMAEMEQVYTEYIRNRHAANQRLEALQRSTAANEWLKECRENSSDITNAWNLDALLVKPVQRITKYPLLLKQLIDSSVDDHPDLPALKRAFTSVTDINMRINDVKKHAELVDQVLNRKRGQSDSRAAFTKAFGRRAEKLKQHVGITEMYEDQDYNEIRRQYDNNIAQLVVVSSDCQTYEKGISQWVIKMEKIAAAAEGWVDVGHSNHQQSESKLRQLAIVVRRIMSIALPDHLEHLQNKVVQPMLKAIDLLTKFKEDPKGLLNKRDKRLVDYAQMKHKAERGEKMDKKSQEKMDQWEALNTEAKDRMKRLLRATAHLVQTCQGHLVQVQLSWMDMVQRKLSEALSIPLTRLEPEQIEVEWRLDFDHTLAQALSLSVCNGALLLEAANMTSFLSPGGTTLAGEDSPRQSSWSSANKRSVSITSETSTVPTMGENSRPSGTYTAPPLPADHFDRPYPFPNGRTRAASTTSGKSPHTAGPAARSSRGAISAKHTSASGNFSRPGTSPSLSQEGFSAPRLSVETHSPLVASFSRQGTPERPPSSSTFFSAAAQPINTQPSHRSAGSGVFSSAMPMSDSPDQERHTEPESKDPEVLFTAASVYEFNIDKDRREAGFPYLTYVAGEIFDIIGERGELWLAKNQDDPHKQVGWIWNKHFAKLQT